MILIIPKWIYGRYGWRWDDDILVLEDDRHHIVFTSRTVEFRLDKVDKKQVEEDVKEIIAIDGHITYDKYRNVIRGVPHLTHRITLRVDESTYEILKKYCRNRMLPMTLLLKIALNKMITSVWPIDEVDEYLYSKAPEIKKKLGRSDKYIT